MFIMRRGRRLPHSLSDHGFTLIELVLAIAIMAILMVSLSGVMIQYFKNTTTTAARLDESAAVQFVSAYWQRDVSSLGVKTYDSTNHVFTVGPSTSTYQSTAAADLALGPLCGSSTVGTRVITLAWNEYAAATPDTPTAVSVSYYADTLGGTLTRVRCSGSTLKSSTVVSKELYGLPVVQCDGGACFNLTGAPRLVTMDLKVLDSSNNHTTTPYQVVLTGERRQS